MGPWRAAVLLSVALSACSGPGGDHADVVVFRVGAPSGLSRLVPGEFDGSAAQAADLVFELYPAHVADIEADGAVVVLTRKPSSRFSAVELAASVRYKGLVSARAIDAARIEITMADAASAARMVRLRDVAFDVGPFAIELEQPGSARLRRRGNSRVDVIEIVQVSSADEWRKFLARELDVMSSSPSLYRDQFDGMSSVRLLDVRPVISAALYFNVRDPALADAAVRRRIASALNRKAIARVAAGDVSAAAPPPAGDSDPAVLLPGRISLLVVEDESPLMLAASVVRHQLAAHGVVVDIEPAALNDVLKRADNGSYQMALGQLSNGRRAYDRFLSPGRDNPSMTGFSDRAYDAAVEADDLEKARAILDREVPATVLYEWRTFAAIDARFCGDVTPSFDSWRWMADLRPCEDGGEGEGKKTP